MNQDAPEYLTTKEVAAMLRIKPETVNHYYARTGVIPFVKLKRRRLFRRADVAAFIEANRRTGGTVGTNHNPTPPPGRPART